MRIVQNRPILTLDRFIAQEIKMQVNSALNTGLQGFQEAQSRMNQAASDIASQSVTDSTTDSIDSKDLTTSLVELKVAENDAKANVKVIQAASDVLGTLLDVEA